MPSTHRLRHKPARRLAILALQYTKTKNKHVQKNGQRNSRDDRRNHAARPRKDLQPPARIESTND